MGTNIIFDQTANETRTFPLSRLIKGWQVGLEGTRIGDKVKLLIPQGWLIAYAQELQLLSLILFWFSKLKW